MLIDTVKDWAKCSKTGRYLNCFNHSIQDHGSIVNNYINTGNLNQARLADHLAEEFKRGNKKTSAKTIKFLSQLLFRLIVNGQNRVIQVNSDCVLSIKAFKSLVIKLEALGWVEIYQGYPSRKGSRPMAVQLKLTAEELAVIEQGISKEHGEVD